jgi:hypothetical protein
MPQLLTELYALVSVPLTLLAYSRRSERFELARNVDL